MAPVLGRMMALQVVSVWNRAFLCRQSLLSDPPGTIPLNDWRVPPDTRLSAALPWFRQEPFA
jgi:hypothetical protein